MLRYHAVLLCFISFSWSTLNVLQPSLKSPGWFMAICSSFCEIKTIISLILAVSVLQFSWMTIFCRMNININNQLWIELFSNLLFWVKLLSFCVSGRHHFSIGKYLSTKLLYDKIYMCSQQQCCIHIFSTVTSLESFLTLCGIECYDLLSSLL